ncbi:serine/threonine protein kinase [Paenibacillus selenitireducens]|uniref:Serine/threonine protein kinase n=1 Tax=Paenibacillus selenitireducens TaxID=1324314 RepID=A0A1T2X5R2_9BACL|nr:serine/threonine protein kinase [Paenibacillus selenitireducens]OPA75219.1 serine/threonine protein kinase [Paenibacillus selenitireducens]
MTLDSVSFQLQEHHDFDWLRAQGQVFCVFDQQDSGNICFGVIKGGQRRFVKYAGAMPVDFSGNPKDAVQRLSQAIPLYTALEHDHLIKLIDHFQVNSGYVAIFEWFEGECLHSHWSYPPPAKYEHPDSPFYRFRHLPLEQRLDSLDVIFSFHESMEAQGYVAVDFYDGSILYDFANHRTKICDIDFYRKAPTYNDMGENFWGARRSKAPEEFILGAPIDSKTNVYTMGAIAFGLLGGEMDHSITKWDADKSLYEVAFHAVCEDREQRYHTVKAFKEAWDSARG